MFFHSSHHPFLKNVHCQRSNNKNVIESPFFYTIRIGHVTDKNENGNTQVKPEIKHDLIV